MKIVYVVGDSKDLTYSFIGGPRLGLGDDSIVIRSSEIPKNTQHTIHTILFQKEADYILFNRESGLKIDNIGVQEWIDQAIREGRN